MGLFSVPIHPDDIGLTAFISNEGLFEFLFMPFGLVNGSFTFQRMMEDVLREVREFAALGLCITVYIPKNPNKCSF